MMRYPDRQRRFHITRCTRMLAAAGILFGLGSMPLHAQVPAMVPVPFGATAAGTPSTTTGAACTTINTIGDGCLPTQAVMTPYSTTVDSYGNIYIADYGDTAIRVVYEGGSALAAAIVAANPTVTGLTPKAGYIYSLAGASGLTKNPAAGAVCSGTSGPTAVNSLGDACPGTQSYVKARGITVDASGNVFFTNIGSNDSVRVLYVGGAAASALITATDPTVLAPQAGYIYTIAASNATSPMTAVGLSSPRDVVVDSSENVYVTDNFEATTTSTTPTTQEVFKTNGTTGATTVVAGNGTGGYNGDNIPATTAELALPDAVFLDANNNLYISEAGGAITPPGGSATTYLGRLRVVYNSGTVPGLTGLTAGNIYTVAGGSTITTSGTLATQLNLVTSGIAGIDAAGNLYFTDNQRRIWQENASTGIAVLLTGTAWNSHPAAGALCANAGTAGPTMTDAIDDGCPGPQVNILNPIAHISFDRFGSFYVADQGADVVRRFSYNTQIPSTTVGSSTTQPVSFIVVTASTINTEAFALENNGATAEFTDGGSDTCALKTALTAGTVCVFNVKFAPAAAGTQLAFVTLASTTATLTSSYLSGLGKAATLAVDPGTQSILGSGLTPSGTGTDLNGNVYISDSKSNQVFRATIGGTPVAFITGLSNPAQIAVDGKYNIYVADTGNNRIAYTASVGGTAIAYASGFSAPTGVAADGYGNLYVADTGNNRIVEVQPGGGQIVLPISGLSKPAAVAVDTSGNLYVADTGNNRVVEFAPSGGQSTVNIGATGTVTPVGIAVDPAGDIYIADTTGMQVIVSEQGGAYLNTLALSLTALAGLAVDATGDVYAADAKTAGLVSVNRSKASITFPSTNKNQSSTASLLLNNTGNATLTATGSQLTTATGNTSVFTIAPANASNACSVGGTVASGTSCQLTATFTPVATTTYTETATFADTATNVAGVSAVLSGTGVQLVSTNTTLAVTAPTGTIVYGEPITVTATVAPATGSGTPTGTVTFTISGQPPSTVPVSGASVTFTPAAGNYTVTAVYSSDSVYASSGNSLSVSVNKATPTIAFNVAQGTSGLNFTATLGSAGSAPTGTVTFSLGSTTINVATLASGVATYASSTLLYSSYTFTATYSGDANYNSVTATSTNTGNFFASQTNSTLTIPQGGTATDTISLISEFGFSNTLTFSCAGLPANTVCAFYPNSVTLSAGSNSSTSMQLITNVQPTVSARLETGRGSGLPLLAMLMPLGLLVFLRRDARGMLSSRSRRLLTIGILLAGLVPIAALSGCGSGQPTLVETPVGTSSVRVTVTGPSSSYVLTYTFIVLPGSTAARP